jgi:hypothetical protein
MPERWASADAYERYVGRWSRVVAAHGSIDLIARAWAARGTA